MKEHYENLYNVYLRICQKKRELMDTNELKTQIRFTERLEQQLLGMTTLLHKCGELSSEEEKKERKRIIDNFSTIHLYGAYIEDGEVYCFAERSAL